MIYLSSFRLSKRKVNNPNIYPYNVFRDKYIEPFVFRPITVLYGNNGSGKSTLLNIIANCLQLKGKEYATNNPTGAFDAIRIAVASTSATAWTNLAANRAISNSPTSLTGFSTTSGSASAAQTFTITGTNLATTANNLVVTAPSNYEIRDNSVGGSYSSSVSFTPAGSSYSKTIDVRISSSASVGSPSGNITVAATGVATQNVAVSGSVTSESSPVLAITGTPTNHGAVCPGTAATTIQYTITNSAAVQADGISVVSSDPQFVVSGLSSTSIAACRGCRFQGQPRPRFW
jgi:energy-coupling factor transporter ATP-binding protein EcfA2